jgi:hypothetical protein
LTLSIFGAKRTTASRSARLKSKKRGGELLFPKQYSPPILIFPLQKQAESFKTN